MKHYNKETFVALLDAGHTSTTPGKRQLLPEGTYFYEWEFNHDVVDLISYKLQELGIKCQIICPETDVEVSNSKRANRANQFCDYYGTNNCAMFSIHSNALGDGKTFTDANGWSVWTTRGKTNSDDIATLLWETAKEYLEPEGFNMRKETIDGDPDYESDFTVIYKTKCPAVLTENLFFTNENEVYWLMTDYGKETIADIHVKTILKLLGLA